MTNVENLLKMINNIIINPNHLFMGTTQDNIQDRVNKRRTVSPFKVSPYCKKSHLFTEESTYIKPNGKRTCRICAKTRWTIANKLRKQERKAQKEIQNGN